MNPYVTPFPVTEWLWACPACGTLTGELNEPLFGEIVTCSHCGKQAICDA